MTNIFPLPNNFPLVTQGGQYTKEFKNYLDMLLARIGGLTGGVYGRLTDGPSITWDLDRFQNAVVVLGGNRTLANPTNQVAGFIYGYRLTVVQDGTGGRLLTWGSVFKFPGGTPPTLTSAANGVDEFLFTSDGTNMKLVGGALDLR